MIRNTVRLGLLAGTATLLVACGRAEPEPVVIAPAPTPIFTKDGQVIAQPTVVNAGGSDFDDDDDFED
ncbi:hypothetical protein [Jannaschia donghaensis]|uniref:Uncharacterized protein n=1 Tax=Jannaschia donghaensis TaxID=420998 RepID=A0A0M6YG97_9RHOB|nr:hypothetical protein [Jannaschia donghaensis]CTQ48297.1 hypothetical protein JDO7802_00299 [Jannaschia donghaensis]